MDSHHRPALTMENGASLVHSASASHAVKSPDAVMPLMDHWPHRPRATSSLSFFLFLLFSPFLSSTSLVLRFYLSFFLWFSLLFYASMLYSSTGKGALLFSASLQLYSSTGKWPLLFSASLVSSFIDFEFLLIDFRRGAIQQCQYK